MQYPVKTLLNIYHQIYFRSDIGLCSNRPPCSMHVPPCPMFHACTPVSHVPCMYLRVPVSLPPISLNFVRLALPYFESKHIVQCSTIVVPHNFTPSKSDLSLISVWSQSDLSLISVWSGAVHKVCHAPRGEGVWESVTVCDRGGGWRLCDVTLSIFSQFTILYFILYCIIHNTNLSCNYHLWSCKKLNLQGFFRVY